jgi:N-acetylmuramoyl-L-alanine amidase
VGAVGSGRFYEKDLCLSLAQQLGEALSAALSARVVFTRDSDMDLPLADRVQRANSASPDIFISVHANSMPTHRLKARAQGVETYFLSAEASGQAAQQVAARENGELLMKAPKVSQDSLSFILSDLKRNDAHVDSSRLAYAVHQRVVAGTGAVDRGVQQAPFVVLSGLEAPAILLEVGFISHPSEGRKLKDEAYQKRLVRSVVQGVADFWKQAEKKAIAMP